MNLPANNKMTELQDAFSVFNEVSQQLASSYKDLEGRVEQLNGELAQAHDARLEELTAKERVADRLETLLKALPAGVIVLDSEGYIQESNPQAIELLGEPLQGLLWREVIARAFAPRSDDGHEISLRDGRLVSISTQALGSEPGQIILLQDVTEARILQKRLNQHKRLSEMGEMAASLAHQIRTPLSSAMLYGSQLSARQVPDLTRIRVAERIVASLRHLESLVNDMLIFARGDAIVKQPVSLQTLLQATLASVEPLVKQSQAEVQVENLAGELQLTINQQAVLGSLQNLIDNAIQVSQQPVSITLSINTTETIHGEAAILISVADNGPGMSRDVMERVFDPFYTTRDKGTGLGLAVVQAVARAHHGTVWVDSEEGAGTTFTIYMPINQKTDASELNIA
jgi:two-component system sensor histidine kinase FlrB